MRQEVMGCSRYETDRTIHSSLARVSLRLKLLLIPLLLSSPSPPPNSKPLEGGANGDPCGGMRLVANKDLSASGYLSVPQEAAAVFDDALAAYKPLEDEWTHLELPPSDPLVAALLKRPDGRLRKLKPGVHLIVGGDPAERTLFVTRNENKDLLGEVPVGDLEKASWLADVACLPSSAE